MYASTSIAVSRSAFKENLRHIRRLAGQSEVCLVLKGNAYGHGLELMTRLAVENGVRHLAVFSADEAYQILPYCGDECRVMIMGMIPPEAIEWAISQGVSFQVFSLPRLYQAREAAQKVGKKAKVHLEAETGMHRTGLESEDFQAALEIINRNTNDISFEGLCTHFAGAERISNHGRIKRQIRRFEEAISKSAKAGFAPDRLHAACSAALIRYPETRYDMVRIGIMTYGFFPSPEILIEYNNRHGDHPNPFQRLIRWTSTVMDVKRVRRGEYVGYGTGFQSGSNSRLVAVPVGYAHGFNRSLSNKGSILVRGQRLNVVGLVNMNMLLADATGLDVVETGDEVVLIGRQGDAEISVASFAEISNQVDYELLTRLHASIPRILVD
ncbi:MAG: alanine racemase [Saprospiraceae bacterium]|nr:alanine racemase [Saprospiraceae bacterium]